LFCERFCVYIYWGGDIKVYEENHEASTGTFVHLMDHLDLEVSTERMDEPISADDKGEAGTN